MLEMLVGLEVYDDLKYTQYRDEMKPILHSHGGSFGYDFKISDVLKKETDDEINRVFTIRFPNELKMNEFFSNDRYLEIKEQFFTSSVKSTTIIATYNT